MKNYSNLLINEPPLQVLPTLAVLIGLNEAIVLQQLHYWAQNPKIEGTTDEAGERWIYNTYEEWQTNFPFWSIRTIRRVFTSLEENGYIASKRLAQKEWDQKKFYKVNYSRLENREHIRPLQEGQPVPIDAAKLAACTTTETTAETTQRESVGGEPLAPRSSGSIGLLDAIKLPPQRPDRKNPHLPVSIPKVLLDIDNFKSQFEEWMRLVKDEAKAPSNNSKQRMLDILAKNSDLAMEYVQCAKIKPWLSVYEDWFTNRRGRALSSTRQTKQPANVLSQTDRNGIIPKGMQTTSKRAHYYDAASDTMVDLEPI